MNSVHITVGMVLYCKILYHIVYICSCSNLLNYKIEGNFTDLPSSGLDPDPDKFTPLVLPPKL